MFRAITPSAVRLCCSASALVAAAALSSVALAAETERTNISSSEVQSALQAFPTSFVSPDGRFVLFCTLSSLVAADTNNDSDVYCRDRLLGTTSLISVPDPSTGETGGNTTSLLTHNGARVISDNGRWVVFQSDASNLVANDTNEVSDIFVRDRDADNDGIFDEAGAGQTKTTRVSLTSNEGQSNGLCPDPCNHGSFSGTISGNGRYVAWSSEYNFAGNEAFTNIYRRDRDADGDNIFDEAGGSPNASITELVSTVVTCVGCEQNGFSDAPAISSNGRHIAFRSASEHLVFSDNNQAIDIFVRDMTQPNCVRMSIRTDNGEGEPNTDSAGPTISDNGRYVAFSSANDDLVPEDNGNIVDIFVRDRDTDNDGVFDEFALTEVERVSLGRSAFPIPGGSINPLNNHSSSPCISGDGRYVAFQSDATNSNCGLISCDDDNAFTDVFVHDRMFTETYLTSRDFDGGQANGHCTSATISKTGRFVGFRSVATDLTSVDGNGAASDVYVRAFIGESNSTCAGVETIAQGSTAFGDTWGAGLEGSINCGVDAAPDVWFKFTAACTGQVTIDTLGSAFDTLLSVHSACPGTTANQLACNDDENLNAGILTSKITLFVQQGQMYFIRISGFLSSPNTFNLGSSGFYQLNLSSCSPCCPGNADKMVPGTVNFADITAVLASFGFNYATSGSGDADCNGTVNFADVTEVLSNFNLNCN